MDAIQALLLAREIIAALDTQTDNLPIFACPI